MNLSIDVIASVLMGIGCIILLAAHRRAGAARYRRVTQQGATFFLGLNLMHAGYWMIQPAVRWCSKHSISPSTVSWFSLVPGLSAATAAATGHWGVTAWLLLVTALFDVLDGAVARAIGRPSPAGAVLDSVLDRYAEFMFFTALVVYFRGLLGAQLAVLAAVLGSFLITYSSAKAEALRLTPPRGSMKRSDRLALLIVGTAFTPLCEAWLHTDARLAWPVLIAVGVIGILANVSAIRRFAALIREARTAERAAQAAVPVTASRRDGYAARMAEEVVRPTPDVARQPEPKR